MDDTQRRQMAWTYALHAEGTKTVFEGRARSLRRRIYVRDFVGFAVPILAGYVLGSEFFEPFRPYRGLATGILAFAATLQILLVLWSVITHWDEELAYSIHAVRESNSLKDAWRRVGQGDSQNIDVEYEWLKHQQEIVDSHDSQKMITDAEKRKGMRSGLIEFQRACVNGHKPETRRIPFWPKVKCDICGGN